MSQLNSLSGTQVEVTNILPTDPRNDPTQSVSKAFHLACLPPPSKQHESASIAKVTDEDWPLVPRKDGSAVRASRPQVALARTMAEQGLSVPKAAAVIGMPKSTAQGIARRQWFVEYLAKLTLLNLGQGVVVASHVMTALLSSKSEAVRLRAASKVLDATVGDRVHHQHEHTGGVEFNLKF